MNRDEIRSAAIKEQARRELDKRQNSTLFDKYKGINKSAMDWIYRERISPVLSGLSTAGFGAPKAIATPEQKENIFPEQKTLGGKFTRAAAEGVGLFGGGAARLAGGTAAKLLPKLAGKESIKRLAGRFALGGGMFGGTQLADEDVSIKGQAGQAIGGAVAGLGIGAGFGATKAVVRALPKIRTEFINKQVVPRMQKLYSQAVDSFSPSVRNHAIKVAKIPKNVVEYIGNRGTAVIRKATDTFDDMAINIKKGFEAADDNVNAMYKDAFSNYKGVVDVDDAFRESAKVLTRHGYIDQLGNRTSISKAAGGDPSLKALTDIYEMLVSQRGASSTALGRSQVGGVNSYVWQDIRNALSKASMRGGKDSITGEITTISNKLHNQAEKLGIKGIKTARDASRKWWQHKAIVERIAGRDAVSKETVLKSVFGEGQKVRDLSVIDDYLGTNYSTRVRDTVAKQALDKIDEIGSTDALGNSKLISFFKQAEKSSEFGTVKKKLTEIIGQSSELDDIFNEIKVFNRVQSGKKALPYVLGTGAALGGFNILKQFGD